MDEDEWAAIRDEGFDPTDIAVIVALARIKDDLHRARPSELPSPHSWLGGGVKIVAPSSRPE